MNNPTVSLFWQGSLSLYEWVCMLSFLDQGFQVEVYSYHALELPAGVICRDAREVLDPVYLERFHHCGVSGCPVAFADLFRYALLTSAPGGIWVDADVFCLRPAEDFMRLQQQAGGRLLVGWEEPGSLNSAVMMVSGFHPLLECMYQQALRHETILPRWGTLGPLLLTELAQQNIHQFELVSEACFYPVHFLAAMELLIPARKEACQQKCLGSYTLHLWNSVLTTYCIPKNILPPAGSFLYELLAPIWPEPYPCLPEQTLFRLLEGTQALKDWYQRA